MMQVEANRLGNVKVTGSQELTFEHGLPGFEELRSFVLLDLDIELPIKLLQSAESEMSLLVGSPFQFYPDYEWDLNENTQQELRIQEASDVEVWSVIILPANASEATINLLAPIVVNKRERVAKQLILHNSSYSNRHPLLQQQANPADSHDKGE